MEIMQMKPQPASSLQWTQWTFHTQNINCTNDFYSHTCNSGNINTQYQMGLQELQAQIH